MAETIFASPIVHEVLNSDNYEEWTIRLKTYLKAHNLWDVVEPNDETLVDGSSVTANDDHCSEQGKTKKVKGETSGKGKSKKVKGEIYGKRKSKKVKGETSRKGQNAKVNGEPAKQGQSVEANDEAKNFTALHAILISCGSDAFSVIKDTDWAKEAWKTLKEKYGTEVVPYKCKGELFKYQDFFEAVRNVKDDWSIVEKILSKHPGQSRDIVRLQHPVTEETGAGNENIVKELVNLMSMEDLEIKGTDGFTALAEAVFTGKKNIAECMVEKNERIVSIAADSSILLLVVDALSYGYNDVLNQFPHLAITVHKYYGSPFRTLAENPAMFPSTSTRGFNFWQRWIYNRIDVQNQHAASNDICCINLQNQEDSQTSRKNICCRGLLKWLRSYISKLLGIELYVK